MIALQGELPVRLQLESQIGDGVRRWHPVPRVFQLGTEAQLQARDPLRGGHGALAGVELHAHHPQVRGHRLHALDELLQRVGHYQQVVDVGLKRPCSAPPGGRRRCPCALSRGSRRSAYSRGLSGLPCRTPRSM